MWIATLPLTLLTRFRLWPYISFWPSLAAPLVPNHFYLFQWKYLCGCSLYNVLYPHWQAPLPVFHLTLVFGKLSYRYLATQLRCNRRTKEFVVTAFNNNNNGQYNGTINNTPSTCNSFGVSFIMIRSWKYRLDRIDSPCIYPHFYLYHHWLVGAFVVSHVRPYRQVAIPSTPYILLIDSC